MKSSFLVTHVGFYWEVRQPEAQAALGIYASRGHAVAEARRRAHAERPSQVVVQRPDGVYELDVSYERGTN